MEFKPAFGLGNRHIQTLFPSFFKPKLDIKFEIERFELNDGDFVDCYWLDRNKHSKIVVILHGLGGSYKSHYIQGLMKKLSQNRFSSVLMHFRGCSGEANRLPRAYHSGDTQDIYHFINSLNTKYPKSNIYGIGFSLGGNIMLKLIANYDVKLKSIITISPPVSLIDCANHIDKGFSKFYQYIMIKALKPLLKNKYKKHDIEALTGFKYNKVDKIKTFWDFDESYTAPIHGFNSAQDYYSKSSSNQYLKKIKIPTLIIHSTDDPIAPSIPSRDEISKFIKLEIYSKGGHVGFISGSIIKPIYWLEDRVVRYLEN